MISGEKKGSVEIKLSNLGRRLLELNDSILSELQEWRPGKLSS